MRRSWVVTRSDRTRGGGDHSRPAATSPFHLTPSIPYHGPMPTHSNAPLTVSPSKGTHLPPHMLPKEGLRIRLRFFANESPYLRRLLPGTNMASFENQIESTATCPHAHPTRAPLPEPVEGPTPPGSNARCSPAAARCGCRACPAPALFPFVDFSPFSTEAVGPRSARALADTTCLPLSTFSTPPSGALGLPSGPCLAATTCLPLSTCPSRLKPKLRRVPPGTEEPEKTRSTIQFRSNP